MQEHHSVLPLPVWRLQQQHVHHVSLRLRQEVGVRGLRPVLAGRTQTLFLTVSRFRSCLLEAGDSISDVVGYTFFNLLKMHCFELSHRLQCTQRNWFGM